MAKKGRISCSQCYVRRGIRRGSIYVRVNDAVEYDRQVSTEPAVDSLNTTFNQTTTLSQKLPVLWNGRTM